MKTKDLNGRPLELTKKIDERIDVIAEILAAGGVTGLYTPATNKDAANLATEMRGLIEYIRYVRERNL